MTRALLDLARLNRAEFVPIHTATAREAGGAHCYVGVGINDDLELIRARVRVSDGAGRLHVLQDSIETFDGELVLDHRASYGDRLDFVRAFNARLTQEPSCKPRNRARRRPGSTRLSTCS